MCELLHNFNEGQKDEQALDSLWKTTVRPRAGFNTNHEEK